MALPFLTKQKNQLNAMDTMKIRAVNLYKDELEEPMILDGGYHKHTLQHTETLDIQHEGQHFYLYWDNKQNALKIIDVTNNGTLCVFPSTTNGILIKSVKQ